jgi:hypothetical protein
MEEGVKIYGLCLERLRHQIKNAKQKPQDAARKKDGIFLLESYNTGDIEDIIDILELYDIEKKNFESLQNKLDEIAYTVSLLTRETISFAFTDEGHLGLYLTTVRKDESMLKEPLQNAPMLAH